MAQALSAEEFQRMQAQLLELRTENYRLSDELRKNGAELSGLRQRVQTLDRDLAKANKALSKSKKAQEVEALLGETRMLQGKLQSQEDDFRLQNSTLLRELAKLCAQIEGLEEENRRLQEGGAGGAPRDPPQDPPGTPQNSAQPPQDGAQGGGGAPEAPPEPPQKEKEEEGGGGDTPPRDPPAPPAQAEVAQLQEEVAKLTEELQEQRQSFLRLQEEKEALLQESRARQDAQAQQELQELQQLQELQELQARGRRLQQELEAATKAQGGLRELSEAQARELQDSRSQRENLERELQVCSGEREELRQRLHEAEAAQERLREEQEQQRGQLEEELGQLRAALGEEQRLRELHEAEGRALRQELKDVRDGQRILEKKGSAALKDLRRQLQLERRRGERLQERLQELLVPSRARSGRGPGGDSSSVSSLGRDGSAPGSTKSGSGSPGGGSGGGVPAGGGLSPAEVAELFQRLAQSQQERWLLEEKVRHLEVSSASMAEDLCRKSAIIQSFVRDSRTEAAGPAGPARRGAGPGPGEEGLREMNKKLQNLLEEQLTKNLHLAQDLESLSQELAQLRKEQAAPQDPLKGGASSMGGASPPVPPQAPPPGRGGCCGEALPL